MGNLGTNREDDMESEYDVLSEDVQSLTVSDARSFLGGSQSSVKTFASGWSKCTNRAFERCVKSLGLHFVQRVVKNVLPLQIPWEIQGRFVVA